MNYFKQQPESPKFIAIAAMAFNRVIGTGNVLPWHFKDDLQFFKRTTLNHSILMGRKTFEGIGKALPKRRNLVWSRTMTKGDVSGIENVCSLDDIIGSHEPTETVFVCGGAQLYELALPWCDELLLTHIKMPYAGDVVMPEFEHLFHHQREIIEEHEEFNIVRYIRRPLRWEPYRKTHGFGLQKGKIQHWGTYSTWLEANNAAVSLNHLESNAKVTPVLQSRSDVLEKEHLECIRLLEEAGFGKAGEVNTLLSMVKMACMLERTRNSNDPR